MNVQETDVPQVALDVIAALFCVRTSDVKDITVIKKGMTNRSFRFTVNDKKYIMRTPGEGTNQFINRFQEAAVYREIKGMGICDDPIYINPETGYKITKYLEGFRVCDPNNVNDLRECMGKLRDFHERKLTVSHSFDIFEQIEHYESLWGNAQSLYEDYQRTKDNVFKLRRFLDSVEKEKCLTHIDAIPDNFLFCNNETEENIQLVDWEYAGMQDPHVDIAMFCIYSLYNKKQVDALIDIYFMGLCNNVIRTKIYSYIAMCGLLWSNWCEYKSRLGVEFGEYALRQYLYAKEYYQIVEETLKGIE